MQSKAILVEHFLQDVHPITRQDFHVVYQNVGIADLCVKLGKKCARTKTKKNRLLIDAMLQKFPILQQFIGKHKARTSTTTYVRCRNIKENKQQNKQDSTVYVGLNVQSQMMLYELERQNTSLDHALQYAKLRMKSPEEIVLREFLGKH